MNKYFIGITIIIVLFVAHVWDKQSAVRAERNIVTLQLNKEYQRKLDEANAKAQKATSALQSQANKEKEIKDAKIKSINSQLSVAIGELHKRSQRPSDVDKTPSVGEVCTGAQLYREDAEFLTREASRAQRILEERDYIYNQYENARKLTKEQNK